MTAPRVDEPPSAPAGRQLMIHTEPPALAATDAGPARLRWRAPARSGRPRVRRQIHLWIPVTPFLLLLSPLIFLIMGIAVLLPRPLGLNPAMAVLGIGRLLVALSGTEVDVDTRSSRVRLKIF